MLQKERNFSPVVKNNEEAGPNDREWNEGNQR